MSSITSRKISRTLSTLAVSALSVLGSSAMAQEELKPAPELRPAAAPWGVYVGAAAGLGLIQWDWNKEKKFDCELGCDRVSFSGKVFGGKRLTPGLAAEVNYLVFGAVDRNNSVAYAPQTNGILEEKRTLRALTLGINWEVELLEGFTNQIRVGWAVKRAEDARLLTSGLRTTETSHRSAPYVGVGLAMNITGNIRLQQGVDYIIDGKDSLYLFSVGASAEF